MIVERNLTPTVIKQYITLVVVTYVVLNILDYHEYGRATIFSFKYLWLSLGAPIVYICGLAIVFSIVFLLGMWIYHLVRSKGEKKK